MTTHYTNKLQAGTTFPRIEVKTLEGKTLILGQTSSGQSDWQMVVVYRGQHCPLCTQYLNELSKHQKALADIGVGIVAVSADSEAQLHDHLNREDKHHFETLDFPIAYGLSLEEMKTLGLYISDPRSSQETDHPFAEPGLFVINEQGTVQLVDYSNGPFARPELSTLVSGLGFITQLSHLI